MICRCLMATNDTTSKMIPKEMIPHSDKVGTSWAGPGAAIVVPPGQSGSIAWASKITSPYRVPVKVLPKAKSGVKLSSIAAKILKNGPVVGVGRNCTGNCTNSLVYSVIFAAKL